MECRKRWGKVYLHLFGQDPEIIHRAEITVVEWASRLMEGRDTTKMGSDDTGLGGWIPRQESTAYQGQHREMAPYRSKRRRRAPSGDEGRSRGRYPSGRRSMGKK